MRIWMPTLGGEIRYHDDLPACCQRESRSSDDGFECVSCGAVWQMAESPESEECGFLVAEERDERGAA